MYQAFIYVLQGTGSLGDSVMWQNYSPVPQPNSYSLFLNLHIFQSLTQVSILLQKTRPQRPEHSFKLCTGFVRSKVNDFSTSYSKTTRCSLCNLQSWESQTPHCTHPTVAGFIFIKVNSDSFPKKKKEKRNDLFKLCQLEVKLLSMFAKYNAYIYNI